MIICHVLLFADRMRLAVDDVVCRIVYIRHQFGP
jgi:hypothetical protein